MPNEAEKALENIEATKEQVANGEMVEENISTEEFMDKYKILLSLKDKVMPVVKFLEENKIEYDYMCNEDAIQIDFDKRWTGAIMLFNDKTPDGYIGIFGPVQDENGNIIVKGHYYEREDVLEKMKIGWEEYQKELVRKKILNPDG